MKKIIIIFISACFLLLVIFLLRQPIRKPIFCELRLEEIRPKLKSITGKELPDKVENLRSILHCEAEYPFFAEELFLAFQTDKEGCFAILEEFGGQNVKKEVEFPDDQYSGDPFSLAIFRHWSNLQKELRLNILDINRVYRIGEEALYHANTGHYQDNPVTGRYLYLRIPEESQADSKTKTLYDHHALVFTDCNTVYICARKIMEGTTPP